MTELMPRSAIAVTCAVLCDDGGAKAASVNAATLALADAGVPLRDTAGAVTCGYLDGEVLIDLNREEERGRGPELLMCSTGAGRGEPSERGERRRGRRRRGRGRLGQGDHRRGARSRENDDGDVRRDARSRARGFGGDIGAHARGDARAHARARRDARVGEVLTTRVDASRLERSRRRPCTSHRQFDRRSRASRSSPIDAASRVPSRTLAVPRVASTAHRPSRAMPESSARSRDAVSGSSDVLSSSERGRRKRARAADDVTGPSLLGFVRVDVKSLDAAAVRAPKYEEPLECGQAREIVLRSRARAVKREKRGGARATARGRRRGIRRANRRRTRRDESESIFTRSSARERARAND